MTRKLAFMTMGALHEPLGHPSVQGFVDRLGPVYDAADHGHGFIARSVRNLQTFEHSWGPIRVPRCYAHIGDLKKLPTTLSIWDDLESVAAFAYQGAHGEVMSKRKEWIAPQGCPTYVAWWVDEGHQIDWAEACERIDHLHEKGSTAFAFNFMTPFDAAGRPCQLNVARLAEKKKINAGGAK